MSERRHYKKKNLDPAIGYSKPVTKRSVACSTPDCPEMVERSQVRAGMVRCFKCKQLRNKAKRVSSSA